MRLLLLAATLAGVPAALGHGYQSNPPSRHIGACGNRLDSIMGTGCTGGGGTFGFSGGTPGLCGDSCMHHNYREEFDAPPTTFAQQPCKAEPTVYTEGGIIDIEWILGAYHGGFLMCNLCDDALNLSQECFDKYPLETVGRPSGGENSDPVRRHEIPPGDPPAGNLRWYIFTGRDKDDPIKQSFRLPEGVTSELATVQCLWWTNNICTYPCEPEVCGETYSQLINNIAWPEGNVRHGRPVAECEQLFPDDGQSPQMFAQCGDIAIAGGDGETTVPPTMTAEEEDTTSPPPVAMEDEEEEDEEEEEEEIVEDVEEEVAGEVTNGNFEGLSIYDIASKATVRLTHMGQDIVDLSDYPEGLGVRAEFTNSDLVSEVLFVTDDGYSHTEKVDTYDMFGTVRGIVGAWPGLEAGLFIKVTVTATMTDGVEETMDTTIDFRETI